MLTHVFRRTARGHAVIVSAGNLPAEQMRLLMRVNGYTPLDLLAHALGEPAAVEALAHDLLAAGLIADVTDSEATPVSAWGALDDLVPA